MVMAPPAPSEIKTSSGEALNPRLLANRSATSSRRPTWPPAGGYAANELGPPASKPARMAVRYSSESMTSGTALVTEKMYFTGTLAPSGVATARGRVRENRDA